MHDLSLFPQREKKMKKAKLYKGSSVQECGKRIGLAFTYPYVINTPISVATEKHLLNNREEALVFASPEDECTIAIGLDNPVIEHVVRHDDRRGTVLHVKRMLLIQNMAYLFVLKAIYVSMQK